MSIRTRVVVTVTFQKIDQSPYTEATAKSDDKSLQNRNCRYEKFHMSTSKCFG